MAWSSAGFRHWVIMALSCKVRHGIEVETQSDRVNIKGGGEARQGENSYWPYEVDQKDPWGESGNVFYFL
jgi:hypothetical protein